MGVGVVWGGGVVPNIPMRVASVAVQVGRLESASANHPFCSGGEFLAKYTNMVTLSYANIKWTHCTVADCSLCF